MHRIVTILWTTFGLVVAMIMVLFINSLLIPDEEPMPESPFMGFRLLFRRLRGQRVADDRDEMSFREADHPYLTSAVNLTEMSPSGMTPVTEHGRLGEQSTPLDWRPRAHSSHSSRYYSFDYHPSSPLPSSPTPGSNWQHAHMPALAIISQPVGESSSHAAGGQAHGGSDGSSSLMTSTTSPPFCHTLTMPPQAHGRLPTTKIQTNLK
ncbi:hypothetical protein C8Q74DRAFT_984095 [Fomes fomentarius]|nr:hypothetical protein C8Q74DRAFT_984095 [Fomes fomentarius]